MGAEADRTGTGKLTFANDYHKKENSDATFFSGQLKESETGKVVFPKSKRDYDSQSNLLIKSLNTFDNNEQKESLQMAKRFFSEVLNGTFKYL